MEIVKLWKLTVGHVSFVSRYLKLYPWGINEESKDYLSLQLSLETCNTGVHAQFKFYILSAKKEKTYVMR